MLKLIFARQIPPKKNQPGLGVLKQCWSTVHRLRRWAPDFSDSVSESRNLGAVFPVFHVTRDHKCVSLTHYLTHYIMIIIVFLEPQRNQKTASSQKFWPIWNKHVFLRSMLWRPRKQLEWGPKTPWWFKAEEFNPDRETYMGIGHSS
jgi:hypothetical protein